MGVTIQKSVNSSANVGAGEFVNVGNKMKTQLSQMTKNMDSNIAKGSKTCPIVSDLRNMGDSLASGDLKGATVSGGILGLYAVSGAAHTLDAKINMGVSQTLASAAAFVSAS